MYRIIRIKEFSTVSKDRQFQKVGSWKGFEIHHNRRSRILNLIFNILAASHSVQFCEIQRDFKANYGQIFFSYTYRRYDHCECGKPILIFTPAFHNSCELLCEFFNFISKYLLWVLKDNRRTDILLFVHYCVSFLSNLFEIRWVDKAIV